jgi:hypothetical protein
VVVKRSSKCDIKSFRISILDNPSECLALIHNGQELAMPFFPGNGLGLVRFQVFDSPGHFFISSLVDRDRFIRTVKTVEQGTSRAKRLYGLEFLGILLLDLMNRKGILQTKPELFGNPSILQEVS